jgi:thymidylate kinase
MILPIPLVTEPENAPKITIIEGPDGSGKTTRINAIKHHLLDNKDIDLRVIRFPDNHGDAQFRKCIMSQEVADHSGAQIFLFLADFIYTFEAKIEPFLNDPKVLFLFDRFIPSTCIYQEAPIKYINDILTERYPEFAKVMSDASYVYLSPSDFDEHKARLSNKFGDEINHLDPVGDEAIKNQIRAYWNFSQTHRRVGILGSYDVNTYSV